jgi:hypothetical protein
LTPNIVGLLHGQAPEQLVLNQFLASRGELAPQVSEGLLGELTQILSQLNSRKGPNTLVLAALQEAQQGGNELVGLLGLELVKCFLALLHEGVLATQDI